MLNSSNGARYLKFIPSKTELKRRDKQRKLEEKKLEKAAAAPPKTEKHRSAEEEEGDLTPSVSPVCLQ